jgi:hypothetical protein
MTNRGACFWKTSGDWSDIVERKLAHLQMLQSVISRLAGNSFLLKGWSVTLVSALYALAAAKANIDFVYLTYFPVVMFWGLDAYFLRQERLYRRLCDQVRVLSEDSIDFSMDTTSVASEVHSWPRTFFSPTLLAFYGVVFGTVVLVMFILAHQL